MTKAPTSPSKAKASTKPKPKPKPKCKRCDKTHGEGTVYDWKGGTPKYTGQWSQGKQHGYGTYYYEDVTKYEGVWVPPHSQTPPPPGKPAGANGHTRRAASFHTPSGRRRP